MTDRAQSLLEELLSGQPRAHKVSQSLEISMPIVEKTQEQEHLVTSLKNEVKTMTNDGWLVADSVITLHDSEAATADGVTPGIRIEFVKFLAF